MGAATEEALDPLFVFTRGIQNCLVSGERILQSSEVGLFVLNANTRFNLFEHPIPRDLNCPLNFKLSANCESNTCRTNIVFIAITMSVKYVNQTFLIQVYHSIGLHISP